MATLRDIEKMTGVSLATISRILNGSTGAAPEKVEKVMSAVQALDYHLPERVSRKKERGRMIVALTSTYGFWSSMYDGMIAAARAAGYTVMIHYMPRELGGIDAEQLLRNVLRPELNIIGLIISNAALDEQSYHILREKYPIVFCGQYHTLHGTCSVSSNDMEAAYELAEHMISVGKRRFVMLEAEETEQFANSTTLQENRRQGFLRAAQKHGIPDGDVRILSIPKLSDVAPAIERLLAEENPPDALFCPHARFALEAEIALLSRGVDIPGQMALASFDADYMHSTWPNITTITQNFREFGVESVHLLESVISGESRQGKRVFIDHSIAIGATTVRNAAQG